MTPNRPWQFAYAPAARPVPSDSRSEQWLICTREAVSAGDLQTALASGGARCEDVRLLLSRAPLFWHVARFVEPIGAAEVEAALALSPITVRYVTSTRHGSPALGNPADYSRAPPAAASAWKTRDERTRREHRSEGWWFVFEGRGVDAAREVCGTGAGVRLAVIDDEERYVDALDLDARVVVGDHVPPTGAAHGTSMIAWAVGSRGILDVAPPFVGIAPDASPRLYLMPKPDRGVSWLPLAIVQAVDDGADVVACASYVEDLTSPLLDDALEFARRLGRGGRGTAIMMPVGREISSPPGSVSASLTLRLIDPASDPRVLCIAPSGRGGSWFLWTDKFGKLRPFGNRGPSVRVAAPGDDIAFPFSANERLGHSESSGATAIAAGVAALVFGCNPMLHSSELYDLLGRTARRDGALPDGTLGDPADVLPAEPDADGHDAKCGYGRLSARRACLAASDPIGAALVSMGDNEACERFVESYLRTDEAAAPRLPYSRSLGRWAARRVLLDPDLMHVFKTLVRHLRLLTAAPAQLLAHGPGATGRFLALALRRLSDCDPPAEAAGELRVLCSWSLEQTRDARTAGALDELLLDGAMPLWATPPGPQPHTRPAAKELSVVGVGELRGPRGPLATRTDPA
jgi:hypothetical protein